MTLKFGLFLLLFLIGQSLMGQNKITADDSIKIYFNEIENAAKSHYDLWNIDLYGPVLLVNPSTRQLYSNFPDSVGELKFNGNIYTGYLPKNINIANTALNWNGIRWAMIKLPLPKDQHERILLLAHELFHKSQPHLGFYASNPDNNHLDQKDGRIYLRLELEALKKCLNSKSVPEIRRHLTNALILRMFRYKVYPGADSTENLLELNEGLAEYTGIVISDLSKEQIIGHFVERINDFFTYPTFVRSFAYQTIPVYGYLLSGSIKFWNKEITNNTNLTRYFIHAFNVSIPENIEAYVDTIKNQYDGKTIVQEENSREQKNKQLVLKYKRNLIDLPHFEVPLKEMNVSFNPSNLVPIEDKGTVYQSVRKTDLWGILKADSGVLISPNWRSISLTNPKKVENPLITGDGWVIELNTGYKIIKDEKSGNYLLLKE